ncbi:BlaI/MecI/CopY family transcriptional regulator [Fulvivirgaceae bacterium BMA12]|uniref:BlaI/MecI/CopY family transcriptional regulator n=1 Tax=Agaribacillus aureus TaxID=3051825 RepID=A0ABT8LEN0_9BACT|nr:BlaI/MecI/CopY family transcriptional regulator [Fulvivirgaceae bacterium BMA12]
MALTKAEEQVMKYLWKLEKSFFKELKAEFPDPKPATTTINTLLKRLIDKGVVDYKLYGNSREYFPLISKNDYFSNHVNGLIKNFFNNSVEQFASFFTKEVDISNEDLKKLRDIVDKKLKKKSND